MKFLLIIIFCVPLFAAAQYSERPDDSLRKISDTTRFPKPFEFKFTANTSLTAELLTKKCYEWMSSQQDSIKSISASQDTIHNIIRTDNIPATADITFSILITVNGSQYTCSLHNYIFHTIDGKSLSVDKAARIKDYRKTVNIEKLIILRNHRQIFDSLDKFLK